MTRGLAVVAVALAVAPSPSIAQVPEGPTFQVNTSTAVASHPRVAARANGDLAFAWCGTPGTISGRVFEADTGAGGPEFQVNTTPLHPVTCIGLRGPRVAAGEPGFVVVWDNKFVVRGRLFNWSGQPIGPEFQVNTSPPPSTDPSAAWTPQGEFLVVWQQDATGFHIHGQRFDSGGVRRGGEFRLDTAGGDAVKPALGAGADGRMVAAWRRTGGDVVGRRIDASGSPVGGEFQVSAYPTGAYAISTAVNDRGSMVVWWSTTPGRRVVGRAFDTSGNPLSEEIVIDPEGGDVPDVAPYGSDRYVVSWDMPNGFPEKKLARVFESTGVPHGPAFVVSGTPDYIGPQFARPQVATDAVGNIAFAWTRVVELVSAPNAMGRRFYGGLVPQALDVDPTPGPSSDGNRVAEACETVALRPAWSNDTASTHTLAGTLSAFTGPPGATYTIVDGVAAYGTLDDGESADCGGDCYTVGVSCASPRPAAHWDATLTETLAPVPQNGRFTLHLGESFQDVPRTSPYYRFVETLLHEGVTAGCGASVFCPSGSVTREQMAVFLLLAKEEPDFQPAPCFTSSFSDVNPSSPTCPYIHALLRRGVTTGCGDGRYCPLDAVTREQMAVFLLRTLDPQLSPPACTVPLFADVPATSPFCRWIEELARRGVVAGCGGGNYCPAAAVTREQMAVYLSVGFGLSLYGP